MDYRLTHGYVGDGMRAREARNKLVGNPGFPSFSAIAPAVRMQSNIIINTVSTRIQLKAIVPTLAFLMD
jgi:hypothetical protein